MIFSISLIAAFLVTLTLIPIVIRVSKSVNLLDQPDKRKIHSISTPSFGGIAIYCGILIALLLSVSFLELAKEKYFIGASFLIFLLGFRDDIASLQARHKLVVQLFAAFLVIFLGGIKISGLNGLFGVNTFGWYFDELFTMFIIVVMTNAFNLIDGIDGLAGMIGLIISSIFGIIFLNAGMNFLAILSFTVSGAVFAFLLYNWHPSKIFMGDTGSMILGFMLTVLMVRFLKLPFERSALMSPVAISLSLFILPVYDTLRVFFIRFFEGRSPLSPDRNHIHHIMLKLGYNHAQSTILLGAFNLFMIISVFLAQPIGELWLMLSMLIMTVSLGIYLDRKVMKREAKRKASLISSEVQMTKSA